MNIYEQARLEIESGKTVAIQTVLNAEEGSIENDMHRLITEDLSATESFDKNGASILTPTLKGDGEKLIITEPVLPRERLILLGGGHIAVPVCEFAAKCGFEVYVCDDRPDFANEKRFPLAKEVLCDTFENNIRKLKITPYDYIVGITRGHVHDADCLREILPGVWPAYFGQIGSRRRVAGLFDMLEEEGYSREKMNRICTPIGLDIDSVTPEEIGISIVAELISYRRQAKHIVAGDRHLNASDLEPDMIEYLASNNEPKSIVTVIETKGSTPRQEGAKMAVDRIGQITGSIGGGCSEGAIIRDAIDIIGSGEFKTCFIDMRGEVAESDGMVCGGTMKVLIEDATE